MCPLTALSPPPPPPPPSTPHPYLWYSTSPVTNTLANTNPDQHHAPSISTIHHTLTLTPNLALALVYQLTLAHPLSSLSSLSSLTLFRTLSHSLTRPADLNCSYYLNNHSPAEPENSLANRSDVTRLFPTPTTRHPSLPAPLPPCLQPSAPPTRSLT